MGFPFYEEQRITVTVLLFAVSSSGEVDSSVTFDTRDAMFCTFVTIQSFFSSTKEKYGMFYTVWQQRALFCHKPKKKIQHFPLFDNPQSFSYNKTKGEFLLSFFVWKSAP